MKKLITVSILVIFIMFSVTVRISAYITTEQEVRSESSEYTIDDDGRFTNPMDVIHFETFSGKTIAEWKALGYNDVKITIIIDMREVRDGYQYIFIYRNDYSTSTENYLFYQENIEHGPGELDTEWADYTFTTITIDLDDFVDGKFIVRYGASGNWSDDWKNRNLRVYFDFDY